MQRALVSADGQFFRVALNCHDEAMIWELDAFNQAVGGLCRNDGVAPQRLDALMMEAVDRERLCAQQVCQACIRGDSDDMGAIGAGFPGPGVFEAVGALGANILIEAAARGDVEQLQAPSDTQDG